MPKNEETKPFTGGSYKLKKDTAETRTITIEDDSEDLGKVTKNSSRAIKEATNTTSSGKRWNDFGNGKKCEHNFGGDVVRNVGGTKGNIIKGKNAAENIRNAKGSIICDGTGGSSNDAENDEWGHFGNGEDSRHNFAGKLVINEDELEKDGKD